MNSFSIKNTFLSDQSNEMKTISAKTVRGLAVFNFSSAVDVVFSSGGYG